jgi:hypothetical protein
MGWSDRRIRELAARQRERAAGPYTCEGCGRRLLEARKLCAFCEDSLRRDVRLLNQMTAGVSDADDRAG